MTTTTTDPITDTMHALQRELDAMPDPRDVPNTYRAQEDDARTRSFLTNGLQTLRVSRQILAEVAPQVTALETWHAHLLAWRQTLVA